MVAVILINYNLSSETISCVRSILQSKYENITIYLVDNGSERTDLQSLQIAFENKSNIILLRIEQNIGYVGGVNYGLKKASEENPDYFLIMNNDTIIDKLAIGYLVDAAKRYDNRAILSGKVYYYDQPDVLQHTGVIFRDKRYFTTYYPGRNEKDNGQYNTESERDSLDDVFWLLPAEIIKDVGFYCDYFYLYAEQGDYAQRARRAGYKLIYIPTAKIWHKESMTVNRGKSRGKHIFYWRGQGIFIFQYRNMKKKYFYRLMIKNFIRFSAKSIFKKGEDRKRSFALLRGYFYGFKWIFNKKPNNGYNPYLSKSN
jgi:GT2 family glycosyltransferase